MKKIVFAMAVLSLAACKKNETVTTADNGKVTTEVSEVKKQTAEEFQKIDVEKLKTATPATEAQLESVLPESVNGVPRKKMDNAGGIRMVPKQAAMGTYMNGNDFKKMYTVMVVDAAGADASKYQAEFEKYKNSEMAQNVEKNTKMSSEVINGNRVFFSEMDMQGFKGVGANMMVKGRYAVAVSGTGLTKEAAKDVISKLDLSQLP